MKQRIVNLLQKEIPLLLALVFVGLQALQLRDRNQVIERQAKALTDTTNEAANLSAELTFAHNASWRLQRGAAELMKSHEKLYAACVMAGKPVESCEVQRCPVQPPYFTPDPDGKNCFDADYQMVDCDQFTNTKNLLEH